MILTGQIEGDMNRWKQRISYLANFSKFMAGQSLGEIKKTKIIESYKSLKNCGLPASWRDTSHRRRNDFYFLLICFGCIFFPPFINFTLKKMWKMRKFLSFNSLNFSDVTSFTPSPSFSLSDIVSLPTASMSWLAFPCLLRNCWPMFSRQTRRLLKKKTMRLKAELLLFQTKTTWIFVLICVLTYSLIV